jgi:hypothetical protein
MNEVSGKKGTQIFLLDFYFFPSFQLLTLLPLTLVHLNQEIMPFTGVEHNPHPHRLATNLAIDRCFDYLLKTPPFSLITDPIYCF